MEKHEKQRKNSEKDIPILSSFYKLVNPLTYMASEKTKSRKFENVTFAMGCFWQPDYIFSKVKGVIKAEVGYTGGKPECVNPMYKEVCGDETGHAEAIKITFDPKQISYEELLDIFWTSHDPTQLNRQGRDVGLQYRSAVFYHSEEQKKTAFASKAKREKRLIDNRKKIVTEIAPAAKFYKAEEYHHKYLEKTGRQCHIQARVFR